MLAAVAGRRPFNFSRVPCCLSVLSTLSCRLLLSSFSFQHISRCRPAHCQYTVAAAMTSRRSGRVAAQQLAKPSVSYKEVNSDDDSSGRRGRGAAVAAAAAAPDKPTKDAKGKKEQQAEAVADEEDDNDDDVIVVDDGEADDVAQPDEQQRSAEEDEVDGNVSKGTKRKRAAAATTTKQRKSAKQKVEKKKSAAAEEAMEQEEEEGEAAEEEEKKAKPAKGAKRKRAAPVGKKSKKAAAGDEADPISVDDEGDGEDEDKPKKKAPAKPKKEKQPALIPHIRTVSTAHPQSKKLLGAHVGTAGGVHFGPHNAAVLGARCFAMDTRSKRRWASPPYSTTVIDSFHSHMAHYGYSGSVVLPHGSYLTNLGCLSDKLWEQSKACIREELERCQQLGVTNYVFHPGRASTSGDEREEEIRQEKEKKKLAREKAKDKKKRLKAGEEVSDDEDDEADTASSQPALDASEYLFTPSTPAAVRAYITAQPAVRVRSLARLVTALNELLSPAASIKWKDVHILIETMAAVGNQLCSRFEELRYVIDALVDPSHIGVCIDTCHVFAADARYDMRQRDGYERVMGEVGDIIGWQYVKGMHMNDSKCALGSHRDRHENIGDGEIGIDLFTAIMNDSRWDGVPMVLETPCKTESKEAAKRKKKALAAGEAVEDEEGEDEEDEGDDDDGEDGGKKGKGKGKAKAPKEKEDWVKSYSEEIDMVYGLEDGDRKQANGIKKENGGVSVKSEEKERAKDADDAEDDEEKQPVKEEMIVTVTEVKVEEVVKVIPEKVKQKPIPKKGRRGKAGKATETMDETADGEDE